MIQTIGILIGILLAVILFLIFGFVRVFANFEILPEEKNISIQIKSWKNVLGIEWTQEYGITLVKSIVLNRAITLKQKCLNTHPKGKKQTGRKKKKPQNKTFCLVRNVGNRIPRFLKRFFHCMDIDSIDVRGVLGTKNPAVTGILYGCLRSLSSLQNERFHVSLSPYFCGTTFEGKITLILHFIMVQFLWYCLLMGVEVWWIYRKCNA